MDTRKENDKSRYWTEVVDEKTGTREVTVAAEITVTFDDSGVVAEDARLVIAGGSVATGGLVTVAEVTNSVIEVYDTLPDDDIHMTTRSTSDADLQSTVPPAPAVRPEIAPHERTRQEATAAALPQQFV